MKIENSYQSLLAPSAPKVQTRTPSTASESAEVQLSGVHGGLASSDNQPPVDSAKIQQIKQAIAEGRFAINPNAIADRLIASAKEMVASQRQA